MKTLLKQIKLTAIVIFIFWITYTIVFLFIDGWHWKAGKGSFEAILDTITSIAIGWLFGMCFIAIYKALWFIAELADKYNISINIHEKQESQ